MRYMEITRIAADRGVGSPPLPRGGEFDVRDGLVGGGVVIESDGQFYALQPYEFTAVEVTLQEGRWFA